mgnify:CR=1 FL=1
MKLSSSSLTWPGYSAGVMGRAREMNCISELVTYNVHCAVCSTNDADIAEHATVAVGYVCNVQHVCTSLAKLQASSAH